MKFLNWRRTLAAQGALACTLVLASGFPARAQQPDSSSSNSTASAATNQSSAQAQPRNLPNAVQPQPPVQDLTLDDRFHLYLHTFTSVTSVIGPALGAGVGQWRNEPPEWAQESSGYGRRFASGYARRTISETIRFGVAAADGEDPRFYRSGETALWPRARHAILATFISHTRRGTRIPAYSRFAGTYGAALASMAWYPASRNDAPHVFERGSTALGSSVAWNVLREFWPDIRGAFRHDK